MLSGRKTIKSNLRIKKKYERKFLKAALALCFHQIKYSLLRFIAGIIFPKNRRHKTTKFLRFINKTLVGSICKCQKTAEKCEYYQRKIELFN